MYKIAIQYNETLKYPLSFLPDSVYPETPFKKKRGVDSSNYVYKMLRDAFISLDLDKENADSADWNPLKSYVKPGNTVVIKPNLVLHKNYRKGHSDDTDCVFTHPSVVAAIIDYVVIALNGNGKIIVGDAPIQECDFETLITKSGYKDVVDYYRQQGVNIQLKDFRGVISKSDYGVLHQTENPKAKYTIVNMNKHSEFATVSKDVLKRIRITNYDPEELLRHHNENVQEYCVAQDILNADCIINVPKPKTHKKAGITACLKNLVGMNCRKEYLPHHTIGSVEQGGDEYCNKSKIKEARTKLHDAFCENVHNEKYLKARACQAEILAIDFYINHFTKDKTSFGSWAGNNTISKTTIDLNKIAIYADKNGIMQDKPQRTFLNIADMIISGQHNGPMAPEPRPVGILLVGENSFASDLVIAKLMRAKIDKIPTLNQLRDEDRLKIYDKSEAVKLISNDARWNGCTLDELNSSNTFKYKSPDDWEECFE